MQPAIETKKTQLAQFMLLQVALADTKKIAYDSRDWPLYKALTDAEPLVNTKVDHLVGFLAADMMVDELLIIVDFCHDLEDSWLSAKFPGGDTKYYNFWRDLKPVVDAALIPAKWIGPDHYMPSDFDKELKVYLPNGKK